VSQAGAGARGRHGVDAVLGHDRYDSLSVRHVRAPDDGAVAGGRGTLPAMKFPSLAVLALVGSTSLVGCSEQVNVTVQCVTTAEPGVECDLAQVKGKSEVEVCWDFSVTCANGTKIDAPRSCAKVRNGGTTKYKIPGDKLANVDKCDGEPKASVTNLTLNGERSQ